MQIPLNPQQKEACEAPLQPLLIIAGAGTGKTRVLTSRLLYLIENGANPAEICAITFTNKAAKEMEERILAGIRGGSKPIIGTFHSMCARILRKECRAVGRTPNFVIFDESDSFSLLKKIVKEVPQAQRLGAAFFRDQIGKIKDGTLRPSADTIEDELVLQIFTSYEEALKKNNAFDFDDLIHKTVHALKNNPSILEKYKKQIRHVLVDEYQDVSNMQYELIKLLGGEADSLSVVGDSDQTIYTWRGSNIKYFLGFERDWPNSKVVFLEENYRSTSNIIEAANILISNNSERPSSTKDKSLWTQNPAGNRIKIYEAANPDSEAWWIATNIENIPLNRKSVAILYRTNAQSRAIEQALLNRQIPYIIYGGLKFYERREIKDILAGLRYVSNPDDSVSQERLLKTFKKRVFPAIEQALKESQGKPPVEILQTFLKATQYFMYMDKNYTNPGERRENIAELIRFSAEFNNLEDLLERVSLLQSTDQSAKEDREHSVNLMTIHLAKGLEFDTVFVAGVCDGIIPHARTLSSGRELEEERRLMYVAMTRARQDLNISFYDIPSRFLSELPGNCTSFVSEVSDDTYFEDSEERYISLD